MSISSKIIEIKNELPSTVKLVAVSKFHPVDAILQAYDAGQRIFAENRPQELKSKVETLDQMGRGTDIQWHFIGHLQTNKLKMVLPYVSLVQSVDTRKLFDAINSWAQANGRTIPVLLEMHIASEESKQGFSKQDMDALLNDISTSPDKYPGIEVKGIMGMASLTDDTEQVRQEFASLTSAADEFAQRYAASAKISMKERSFGMSGDYRIAAGMGSTMVRIGTAIFGERQY